MTQAREYRLSEVPGQLFSKPSWDEYLALVGGGYKEALRLLTVYTCEPDLPPDTLDPEYQRSDAFQTSLKLHLRSVTFVRALRNSLVQGTFELVAFHEKSQMERLFPPTAADKLIFDFVKDTVRYLGELYGSCRIRLKPKVELPLLPRAEIWLTARRQQPYPSDTGLKAELKAEFGASYTDKVHRELLKKVFGLKQGHKIVSQW